MMAVQSHVSAPELHKLSKPQQKNVRRCTSLDLSNCEVISPSLKCQFSIPTDSWITGIDVNSDNRILLSAGKSCQVFLYTEDGELLCKETFSSPLWDCGLMSDGKIALLTEEAINVYTSDFFYVWKIKLKNFTSNHMVIDQDNFVIVADIVNDKVRIYNGFNGQPVAEFSTTIPTDKKHLKCKPNHYQTAVAINSKDEIFVADPIQPVMRVFSNSGNLIGSLPIVGQPQMSNHIIQPRAICVDKYDRLWFADDCGKHLYVAPMYGDEDGNLAPSGCLYLEAYGLGNPQAMVCTHQGHLVVVDEHNQAAVLQI